MRAENGIGLAMWRLLVTVAAALQKSSREKGEFETESTGNFSQSFAPPGPKKWGWELVANMRRGMKSSFFFFLR